MVTSSVAAILEWVLDRRAYLARAVEGVMADVEVGGQTEDSEFAADIDIPCDIRRFRSDDHIVVKFHGGGLETIRASRLGAEPAAPGSRRVGRPLDDVPVGAGDQSEDVARCGGGTGA